MSAGNCLLKVKNPRILKKKFSEIMNIFNLFIVHIVADTPEERNLYSENMNVINAVSKIENVKIISSSNYVPMENSLCDNVGETCSIFLVIEVRFCYSHRFYFYQNYN